MRLAVALVGLLLAVPAFAQTGTVRQNGTVSPGHPTMWTTTGIIQDAGTSAKGGLTTLGITAPGSTPFCINNGQTTGPYSAFCLGANPTSGNALLSVTAVNGATPMGLNFNMNGNLSSFAIAPNGTPTISGVSPAAPFSVINPAGGTAFKVNSNALPVATNVTAIPNVSGGAPLLAADGTDTNIGLKLAAKGTSSVQSLSPFFVTPNPIVAAGSLPIQTDISLNASGTMAGATQGYIQFIMNTDTVTKTDNSFEPLFTVIKNWGGGTGQRNQQAMNVDLVQTGPVAQTPPTSAQMVAMEIGGTFTANVGGTSLVTPNAIGAAYAFAPTSWLHPGATNYEYASVHEDDQEIDGSEQILTVGGTVTAGSIALTITSASISGSPVTVTWNAAAGNVTANAVNGIIALIMNNTALAAAGVSARPDPSARTTKVDIFWQTQDADTTIAVVPSGGPTATLGSVVTGASAAGRDVTGLSVRGSARGAFLDMSTGANIQRDAFIGIGCLTCTTGGTIKNLILIRGEGGVWPLAPGGALLNSELQIAGADNGLADEPFWSPQLQYGFNLSNIDFTQYSGYPWLSPGIAINSTGVLRLGSFTLGNSSDGLTIASSGVTGSGNPTIVSGGGGGSGAASNNYFVGDIVHDNIAPIQGEYQVTAVNGSTGAVSAGGLTTLVQPSAASSCGTAIPTTGGSGVGLTITPTCAANNNITLASTAILTPNIPTSAPAAHCTWWNNSGVINITTCP